MNVVNLTVEQVDIIINHNVKQKYRFFTSILWKKIENYQKNVISTFQSNKAVCANIKWNTVDTIKNPISRQSTPIW